MGTDETFRENARQELHKNVMRYIEKILKATSNGRTVVQTPISKTIQIR